MYVCVWVCVWGGGVHSRCLGIHYAEKLFSSECAQAQIRKRGIKTITGLGRHYRQLDTNGSGLLLQHDLERGLLRFHIDLQPQVCTDSLWETIVKISCSVCLFSFRWHLCMLVCEGWVSCLFSHQWPLCMPVCVSVWGMSQLSVLTPMTFVHASVWAWGMSQLNVFNYSVMSETCLRTYSFFLSLSPCLAGAGASVWDHWSRWREACGLFRLHEDCARRDEWISQGTRTQGNWRL